MRVQIQFSVQRECACSGSCQSIRERVDFSTLLSTPRILFLSLIHMYLQTLDERTVHTVWQDMIESK